VYAMETVRLHILGAVENNLGQYKDNPKELVKNLAQLVLKNADTLGPGAPYSVCLVWIADPVINGS
jgi:hypothetical protein